MKKSGLQEKLLLIWLTFNPLAIYSLEIRNPEREVYYFIVRLFSQFFAIFEIQMYSV